MLRSLMGMHLPLRLLFFRSNVPNLRCAYGELLENRKDDWLLQDPPEVPLHFTQAARYPAFTTTAQLQAVLAVRQDASMLRPDH